MNQYSQQDPFNNKGVSAQERIFPENVSFLSGKGGKGSQIQFIPAVCAPSKPGQDYIMNINASSKLKDGKNYDWDSKYKFTFGLKFQEVLKLKILADNNFDGRKFGWSQVNDGKIVTSFYHSSGGGTKTLSFTYTPESGYLAINFSGGNDKRGYIQTKVFSQEVFALKVLINHAVTISPVIMRWLDVPWTLDFVESISRKEASVVVKESVQKVSLENVNNKPKNQFSDFPTNFNSGGNKPPYEEKNVF